MLWRVILGVMGFFASLGGGESPMGSARTFGSKAQLLWEEYFDWKQATYPEWATVEGVDKYDDMLEDFSLEAIQKKEQMCQQFVERGEALKDSLGDLELIYMDTFLAEVRTCVEGFKFKGYLFPPINNLEGIQFELPRLFREKKLTKLNGPKDYENLLKRISKIPDMIEKIIVLLKMGMKEGVTYAKESITYSDFDRLQVQVNASDFYVRFRDMPGILGRDFTRTMKTKAYETIENNVLPAFKKLGEFLKNEYSLKLRSSPGVSSIPNGQAFYSEVLKWHISTNQTVEEVHKIGLQEVDSIMKGVKEVIEKLGKNVTFKQFSNQLRTDQSQEFSSKQDALKFYSDLFVEKINPAMVNLMPPETLTDEVNQLQVEEAPPPGGALAYYQSPSQDGSRRGTFFVKLEPLSRQKIYEGITLALHEGNPGHHYQAIFNNGQLSAPKFIKNPMYSRYSEAPSRFPMNTAHTEGWGLYSEFLGFEMGLYEEDLYARFGHYSYNLLRAARLVVDTGIHSLGWSRKKAIDYMINNTAMSRANIEGEVDRYITWPGQACAYKIGEIKIRELRSMAEERLGAKFSVKEFHRRVLQCAGPLNIVEQCVENYLSAAQRRIPTLKPSKVEGVNGAEGRTAGFGIVILSVLMIYRHCFY